MTTGGGYGVLYGPNIANDGADTGTEGLVAGSEHLAFSGDGNGRENVTLMVQVPDSFDRNDACVITAPSSGSRGVYGAIGTTGDWGLKQGCAVAYTDKGTGNGGHNLQTNTVGLVDGQRADADVAGKNSQFTAGISGNKRAAINAYGILEEQNIVQPSPLVGLGAAGHLRDLRQKLLSVWGWRQPVRFQLRCDGR